MIGDHYFQIINNFMIIIWLMISNDHQMSRVAYPINLELEIWEIKWKVETATFDKSMENEFPWITIQMSG